MFFPGYIQPYPHSTSPSFQTESLNNPDYWKTAHWTTWSPVQYTISLLQLNPCLTKSLVMEFFIQDLKSIEKSMRREDKYKARIKSLHQAFIEDQRMFDHFWAQHSENLMKLVIENQVKKATEKFRPSLKRSSDELFPIQSKRRCKEDHTQKQLQTIQKQLQTTQKQLQLTQKQQQNTSKDARLPHTTTADSETDDSTETSLPNRVCPDDRFYKILQAVTKINPLSNNPTNDHHTVKQLAVQSASDQQATSTPTTTLDQQPASVLVTDKASAHQTPIEKITPLNQDSTMTDTSLPEPVITSQCSITTVTEKESRNEDEKENGQKEEEEASAQIEEEEEEEDKDEETTSQTEENESITCVEVKEVTTQIEKDITSLTKEQKETMTATEKEEGKNTIETEVQEEEDASSTEGEEDQEEEENEEEEQTTPTEKEDTLQNEKKKEVVLQVSKKQKVHHIKLSDSNKKTRTEEEAQRKDIVEVDMLFYNERRSIGTILKRWAFTVHTALYRHKQPMSDLAKRNMALGLSSVLDLGQCYRVPDSHGSLFGAQWATIKKDLMAKSPLSVTKDEVKLLYDKQCRRKNMDSVYHEIQSKTTRGSSHSDIVNLWRILRHWLTLLRQKDSILSGPANTTNIEYFHCLWSTIFQLLFPAAQKIRLKIGDLDHHHLNNNVFSFKLAVQIEGKEISLAVGECSTTHAPVEDRLIRKGKVALDDMIQLTGLSEDTRCMTWLIHITGLSCTLSTIELLANGLYVHIPRYSFKIPCSFSDVRLFGQAISELVKMQHELRLALDLMLQHAHRPKHTRSHRSKKSGWIRDTWYAPQVHSESRLPTYFTKPPPLHRKIMVDEEDP